ncbi:MAG TPA: peptidoglycan binding domain-containing protein, partial [Anaerolineales bacterium]|nr:peptidoglycan binding domain-containing protein [Anaerolineales bacterium]
MNRRRSFSFLRWASVGFILAAVALFAVQLVQFSKIRANFPQGLTIGGVSVGQEDRQGAAENLLKRYSLPLELRYLDQAIVLDPAVVGFELDLESMLAAADQQRTGGSFWTGLWDFLWIRKSIPQEVPLAATYSEARLRTYLEQEIAARYDQPPVPAQPLPGTVNFSSGTFGTTLDIDSAVTLIETALFEAEREPVTLPLERQVPPRPSPQNLETLLRQTIELTGFDGVAGLYLKDLQTGQEIH